MNNINFTELKPASYNRKSSEAEDRQMLSIDSQRDEAQRIKDFHKLPDFIEIFEESKSAKKEFARPGFTKMVNRIKKGEIDSIVCWKPDRLARNMTEGGELIDLLSAGVLKAIITHDKVYYPWDNVIVLAVEFSQGKQFIKDLSTNVKRGQTKKASIGVPHGVATLGFKNDKTEEKGNRRWLVDQERHAKIETLLKMFLTGEWSAGKLYKYAVDELKLTTVKHKKIGGSLIVLSRIYEILKDPTYAGFFFYGGERYELDKTLPRLITEDEHNKIKMILGKKNIPKTQKHESVFAGFISSPKGEYIGPDMKYQLICDCKYKFAYRDKTHCPKCGMAIEDMQKPKYLSYTYYYNNTKKKSGLKYVSTNDDDVTAYVIAEVGEKISFSPELADWCRKHIQEMRDEEVNANLFKEQIALKDSEDYVATKKRYRQMLAERMITEEEYKSDLVDLEARHKPSNKPVSVDWTVRANEIVSLSEEFSLVMSKGEIKAKRAVLHRLGSNLIWDDKELNIINAKPVQALFDGLFLMQTENLEFEPKKCVVYQGSKEKTEVFSSVFSTLLPLLDAFRTANWKKIKRDLEVFRIFESFGKLELQN